MRPLLLISAALVALAWGGRHALMAQGEESYFTHVPSFPTPGQLGAMLDAGQGEPVRAWFEHEDGGVEVYDGGFTMTTGTAVRFKNSGTTRATFSQNDAFAFYRDWADGPCFTVPSGWMDAGACPTVVLKQPYSCDGGVCTPQGTK